MKIKELPFFCVAYSKTLDLKISVSEDPWLSSDETAQYISYQETEEKSVYLYDELFNIDDWEVVDHCDSLVKIKSEINQLLEHTCNWREISKKLDFYISNFDTERLKITNKYFIPLSQKGNVTTFKTLCGVFNLQTFKVKEHIKQVQQKEEYEKFTNGESNVILENCYIYQYQKSRCNICNNESEVTFTFDSRPNDGYDIVDTFCSDCVEIIHTNLQKLKNKKDA